MNRERPFKTALQLGSGAAAKSAPDCEQADRHGRGLVPNATEQAVIERMRAMRASGATYRQIGAEVGMYSRTVQRILDRG